MRRISSAAAIVAAALCVALGGCTKLDPGPLAPEDDAARWEPLPVTDSMSGRVHPETEITLSPGPVACDRVRFRWTGWDADGEIAGYGYSLHKHGVEEPLYHEDDLPPATTTVTLGPLFGDHVFRVWAIDDDGRRDPTPASRSFNSVPLSEPVLTVRSNLLATRNYNPWGPDYDRVNVFTNVPIVFDWTSTTGCDVLRGYDVAVDDTSSLGDSYDPNLTHFELDVEPGLQTLYIEVADSLGYTTRAEIVLDGRDATLDQYVLIVDDWDMHEESLDPLWADDDERDAFYDTLTASCALPVVEWDMTIQIEQGIGMPPGVEALQGASTVIWYTDGELIGSAPGGCGLWKTFHHFPDYRALETYVASGGNLVIAGLNAMGAIAEDASYTESSGAIETTATDTLREMVFIRDVLGLAGAVESGTQANPDNPLDYGYCFLGATPDPASPLDLEPAFIDSVGPGGFPEPGKWHFYVSTLDNYTRCGVARVEHVEPWGSSADVLHRIVSFRNPTFEGVPCAVLKPSDGVSGHVCYIGFPLYYLQTPHAVDMMETVLRHFGEM